MLCLCDPCSALNPGCTDVNATNYNVLATVDDGTCEYNVTFILDMREVSICIIFLKLMVHLIHGVVMLQWLIVMILYGKLQFNC